MRREKNRKKNLRQFPRISEGYLAGYFTGKGEILPVKGKFYGEIFLNIWKKFEIFPRFLFFTGYFSGKFGEILREFAGNYF